MWTWTRVLGLVTDVQETGREEERIVGGIKLPRSERGIFITDRRLVAIDFVKWMTDGKTDEERRAPVTPSDLDKYKSLEARKKDILKIELKAPGRFLGRSGPARGRRNTRTHSVK
jgi:hypothetical protein